MNGPTHPLTERILSGAAPDALCQAAARGAVPVPPEDLLRIRVHLACRGSGVGAETSRRALLEQPARDLLPLLASDACASEVLEYLARARGSDPELIADLVRHPATPDEALVDTARAAPLPILERILDSQQRLLRSAPLLEAAEANPALTPELKTRLLDLRDEIARRARRERQAEAAAAAVVPSIADTAPEAAAEEEEEGLEPALPAGAQFHEEGELRQSQAYQRILTMNVPEKTELAMKGNREERAVLVRSVVKAVSIAVLKNPRLTEQDVESIAAMRSVCDEVIRKIAENKEWTKSYAITLALCRNPKSPVRRTLTLMSRLSNRDLKLLSSDKGVAEAVRTTASRFYVARTQPVTRKPGRK